MKRIRIALLALVAATGCDGGTPAVSSSRDEATVKGLVTVRGKPASGGTVVFSPANISRPDAEPRRAEISKDGAYTVKTLVGGNVISVSGPKFDRDEAVGMSQFTLDVPAGESEFNLVLPKSP